MADSTGQISTTRTKAAMGTLIAAVIGLAGAYLGASGDMPTFPQPAQHPATIAQLDALDDRIDALDRSLGQRLDALEKRLDHSSGLPGAVEGLRQRLDLLLSLDTRRLDGDGKRR